jgi:hypothetical protein
VLILDRSALRVTHAELHSVTVVLLLQNVDDVPLVGEREVDAKLLGAFDLTRPGACVRSRTAKHTRLCGHVREASSPCAHPISTLYLELLVATTRGFYAQHAKSGHGPCSATRGRPPRVWLSLACAWAFSLPSLDPTRPLLLASPRAPHCIAIRITRGAAISTQRPHHGHAHHVLSHLGVLPSAQCDRPRDSPSQ